MSYRSIVAALTILSLAPAFGAEAANEFNFLIRDIDMLDEEMNRNDADKDQQELDEQYEGNVRLFPEGNWGDISGKEEGDGNSTHVLIIVGTGTVVFQDVPRDQWFARYVQDMGEKRIITGYKDTEGNPLGQFGPADDITIEQIAKIAVIAAGVDQSKCPDVPKNEAVIDTWSSIYISCAEHLGWSVYSDGSVDPSRPALRAEVVTTVLQAFDRELTDATGDVFKDVSNTMSSRYAIETAASDGIVSGYSDDNGNLTGFFGPFDKVNRAETAKIVSLAIQTYGL